MQSTARTRAALASLVPLLFLAAPAQAQPELNTPPERASAQPAALLADAQRRAEGAALRSAHAATLRVALDSSYDSASARAEDAALAMASAAADSRGLLRAAWFTGRINAHATQLAQSGVMTAPGVQDTAPHLIASTAEGIRMESGDGRFAARIMLLSRMRASAVLSGARDGESRAEFLLNMVRPRLMGHLVDPSLRYNVQAELAGASARLLDASVAWQPDEAFGIQAGQFILPLTRAFSTPVPLLAMPDFAFMEQRYLPIRDAGVMLQGAPLAGRLEYAAGLMDGSGITNQGAMGGGPLMFARVVYNPLGRVPYDMAPSLRGPQPLKVALSASFTQHRHPLVPGAAPGAPASVAPLTRRTLASDLFVTWGELHALVQGLYRGAEPGASAAIAGFGQLGWMFIPQRVQAIARVGADRTASDEPDTTTQRYEGALNVFVLDHHAKLNLRYAYTHPSATQSEQHPHDRQEVTAQAQIWF